MKKLFLSQQGRGVLDEMSQKIQETFKAFDTPVEVVEAIDGLRQYHFHLKTLQPVRMKVIKGFENDLRYALGSRLLTVEAPIPGEALIGVTVPKEDFVPKLPWSEVAKTDQFKYSRNLIVPIGQDEFGTDEYCDIARAPHVFIAGIRWSGKSMLLHTILCSLITKNTADELRLILIDPQRCELPLYADAQQALAPVITEAKVALRALKWCVMEMERRFDVFSKYDVKNISEYHEQVYRNKKFKGSQPEAAPYIVVVMTEFSDLMAEYPKEFEATIVQLTKFSRAAGIHVIISTQRAITSVFTPLIRARIPTRISFKASSAKDSRAALNREGAENLLSNGDMLFFSIESHEPKRAQGYYITEEEIQRVVEKTSGSAANDAKSDHENSTNLDFSEADAEPLDDNDDLYEEAKEAVIKSGKASTSFLQRMLKIGYSRSARLIDLLEERGVVGPGSGSKPREILID